MAWVVVVSTLFAGILINLVSAESTVCAPGFFITDPGRCRKCTKGTFQPKADQHGCKPCPEDMVSMEEGSTECVSCGENEEPSELNDRCQCVVGAVAKAGGACALCEPGTRYDANVPGRGNATCISCIRGSYQPEAGKKTCLRCPPGADSGYGATECIVCGPDELLLEGKACGTCPAGETWETYRDYCVQCPSGMVKARKGLHPCHFCPDGEEPNADKTGCIPMLCAKGEAMLNKGGNMRCGKCRPGRYYDGYKRKCTKCFANSFMPYANIASNCYVCAGNEFALKRGATECTECPQGEKLLKSGECGTCPAGYEYIFNGSCMACGANTYRKANMAYCKPCPARFYSLSNATTCLFCPLPQAILKATGECGSCRPGTYYDHRTGKCKKCADGTIKNDPGIRYGCESCPLGTKSNKKRTACIPE